MPQLSGHHCMYVCKCIYWLTFNYSSLVVLIFPYTSVQKQRQRDLHSLAMFKCCFGLKYVNYKDRSP